MDRPHGIIVFGPNGSGKTTLGRELARILGYLHMDHEAYAFKESDVPYMEERTHEECMRLMLKDIERHGSFVLSAVTGNFGEIIPQLYELGVHLSAPLDLRIQRIQHREYERHGERIQKGGDMVESHRRFMDFVASRSLLRIDQWAETLACPVLRIDSTGDWRINATTIAARFREIGNHP